jgi:hypothetical protein
LNVPRWASADERDPAWPELKSQPLEPLGRAGEVASSQVAGAARRPLGRVRQADALAQHLELFRGLVQP